MGEKIDCVEYDYPDFHLSMECFWARIRSGELTLKEHEAARWLSREELDSVDWLPADLSLIRKIREADAGGRRNALRLCRSFLNSSIALQRHMQSRRKSEHYPKKRTLKMKKRILKK